MKDSYNKLKVVRALDPAANLNLGTTALTSQWINRKQSGILFMSLMLAIAIGTLSDADAVYDVKLQDADDDGSGSVDAATIADAAAGDVQGDGDFAFGDDNTVKQMGYIGDKQYVRIVITPTTTADAGNTPVSVVGVLGHAGQEPV